MKNPWLVNAAGYPGCQYFAVNDRMEIVRGTTDLNLLADICNWPETQKTVREKAQSKLRRLAKDKLRACACAQCMARRREFPICDKVACCKTCDEKESCNSAQPCPREKGGAA